jgi:hypothetical protein
MKTITVTMTDDVYRDVLDNAMVRRMVGEGHGIMDMAMLKILEAIKDGDDTVDLAYKKDKNDDATPTD